MTQENVETVRRLSEAYRTGDPKWVEFYAPEVEGHMPAGRPNDPPTVYRGLDGIKEIAALATGTFDEVRWDRELLVDAGDRVVALFRQVGRNRRDRGWVETQVAGVFHLEQGKVVLVVNYPSWREALESVQ
jgi:ketosteroid isomerase-like protein